LEGRLHCRTGVPVLLPVRVHVLLPVHVLVFRPVHMLVRVPVEPAEWNGERSGAESDQTCF